MVVELGQLELARQIKSMRDDNKSWNDIGDKFDRHPESCRSILRRYESDLTGEISILSILDKVPDFDELISYRKCQKKIEEFNKRERLDGYGDYFYVSDLHGLFVDRKALKKGIIDAKNRGIKKVIVNGDIFDLPSASIFPVSKDSIIKNEIPVVKDIFIVLANEFDVVYIVKGNHEARVQRRIAEKVNNGIKDLLKNIDPIQSVVDDLENEEDITNIYYTWGNELILGNVIFAHPDYYCDSPGKTVLGMIDTYSKDYKNLSAVIIGHTHYDMKKMFRGIAAFETGCCCFEPDYRLGARRRKDNWTIAYSIFRINKDGNLDYNNSFVIPV